MTTVTMTTTEPPRIE